ALHAKSRATWCCVKGRMPPDARLPTYAAEFLVLLAHVEKTLKSGQLQDDGDLDIQKAKVASYEAALTSRLECWQNLSEHQMEQYRAKIEQLGSAIVVAAVQPKTMLPPPEKPDDTITETVTVKDASSAQLPKIQELLVEKKTPQMPWRRTSGPYVKPRSSAAVSNEARGSLESEMVDLAENMKGAANAFLQTLKKDNERLEDMQSAQDRSLDNVMAHTASGKKLLRSGQMSFFCTMILLAISVVIFCMMIPFIIFT
ncbi:unnamed protein product, partial [Effrenium voratum]